MKILIVGFADSVHTAKWINLIANEGWDIHLFPSMPNARTHPLLRNVTIHHYTWLSYARPAPTNNVKLKGVKVPNKYFHDLLQKPRLLSNPHFVENRLINLIKKEKFDLIHSMELKTSSSLVQYAKEHFSKKIKPFPKWWATNWGSELQIFGAFEKDKATFGRIIRDCDLFSADCDRDVKLAISDFHLDPQKSLYPIIPVTGGLDSVILKNKASQTRPSSRKKILLKGYQTWSGRSLFALKALEKCADILKSGNFEVDIYSANYDVEIAAGLLSKRCGIPFNIIPEFTPHEEILKLQLQSRIYLAASIGDGLPASLLEAMACGAFPIQSDSACTCGWINDGKNGLLIPAEDVEVISTALKTALLDDHLVDSAAEQNYQTILEKADEGFLRTNVIDLYKRALSQSRH